jgi:hypothetical protein
MSPAWPRRALVAGLAVASLAACAHTGPPLEEEVLLEAAAPKRPAWLQGQARSDDRSITWAGRGSGSTLQGAMSAARRDAVTEAMGFYYGPIIDRFFGVETDPSSVFMEDRESNTSKETQNRAIERILKTPEEGASHARLTQQYWERYRIPTDDGSGREMTQAYALITLRRSAADETVAQLLGESPTQIAIAGVVREAAFLVAEAKKQTRDGLAAGRANRIPEMVRSHRRAGELMHDLERVKDRHQKMAGSAIQVDVVEARRGVEALDKLLRDVLASLRLSVQAVVYSGAEARAPGLERLLAGILNGLSIATASPGQRRCAPGHTHWLHGTFTPPSCVRPDEGHVCDLALHLELGRCPSLESVDSHDVDSAALRGRGTSDRRAVLQAWAAIEGVNQPALAREIRVLLSKHIPTRSGPAQ